jgi:hypothetical protein
VIMGIRIQKDIGYIIDTHSDDFRNLFKENYLEILELLDEDEYEVEFFKNLQYWQFSDDCIMGKFAVRSIMESLKTKSDKIGFYQLIRQIGYDSCDYLLFGNPSTIKASRRDDIIDYCEAQDAENHVHYLITGFDAPAKFLYIGGIESVIDDSILQHYPSFEIGKNYTHNDLYGLFSNPGEGIHSYAQPIIDSGCFHASIDDLSYPLARSAGILKEDVRELDFKLALRPAIVTHWS